MAKEFAEHHPIYSRLGYVIYNIQSLKVVLAGLYAIEAVAIGGATIQPKRSCIEKINRLFLERESAKRGLLIQRLMVELKLSSVMKPRFERMLSDYVWCTEKVFHDCKTPIFDDLVDENILQKFDLAAENLMKLILDLQELLINRQLEGDYDDESIAKINLAVDSLVQEADVAECAI